jgi:hypothetical protein
MIHRTTRASSRSRWLGTVALALMAIVATITLPHLSSAATFRSDTSVTIGQADVIRDDLYVMTDTFALKGRVERDVFVAARSVDVDGRVVGSLNVVGGMIDVTGSVGHSVRVTGGNLVVSGTVTGDVMVLAGTTSIAAGAQIDGDVQVYGGTLAVHGSVSGNVSGTVSILEITGQVQGDVTADVDRLEIGSSATITGDVRHRGPTSASIDSDAEVNGEVSHRSISPWGLDASVQSRFFSPLVRTVWLLITGAALIVLAPRAATALNDVLRRPLVTALVGALALVLVPLAATLLLATVIGIPLSLILMTAYFVALYLSQYVVGQRIGAWLLPQRWADGSRGHLLLSMTIGVLLLSTLRYVPVPFVSTAVNLAIAPVGLGASVMLLGQLRPGHVNASAANA